MPERDPAEELDEALEAVLSGGASTFDAANADLSELFRLGVALRGLPRPELREELGAELRAAALGAALRERIGPRDLREAARDLPEMELRRLGSFDRATIGLFHFSGKAPWERHPDGDELIVVLDGGGEITVLAEPGGEPIRAELRPGRLFVCPRGLWHRPVATPSMTALYLTPLAGSEHSWADDPRA